MNRQQLIQDTREVLAKTGFYISEQNDSRMVCFDLVARRDNLLIILKFLTNVDSFSKQNSRELAKLSEMLKGSPLILGSHTSQKKIEPGIVYFRHGIPLINYQTFYDFFIEGFPPLIFSAPGGFYVDIDGEILRKARESRDLSLGLLAEKAGVSRRAIQMYENGMSTMLDVAIRLEEYLKIPLIQPIDPFGFKISLEQCKIELNKYSSIEREIFTQLQGLGYNVVPTAHCPFDALTKDNKILIITGISKQDKKTAIKARIINNRSKITEQYSVIFLEKRLSTENLEGTPIIHKEELKHIDDSDDILTLIYERSSVK
jgi:putative transcriptional regulator